MGSKVKFGAVVGNPPYQENISDSKGNTSLSRQLFPVFIQNSILIKAQYVSLITPARWFTGVAQDKSFVRLRDFIRENNHFSHIVSYLNSKEVFSDVNIPGGINYFLYNKEHTGEIVFTEVSNENKTVIIRPLFEEGLDIVLPMNKTIAILRKITKNNFNSMENIVTGRNPFGVPATNAELNKSTTTVRDRIHNNPILCAYEEIRYISSHKITRNKDLAKRWKVFTSKMNGGAGTLLDDKVVAILGKTFVMEPNTVCSNTLIAIGNFNTKIEAENLDKYMSTKFFRFMLGIKKVSQVLTSNVYEFVPLQDFTGESDIDWDKSIKEIDTQLYKKYDLSQEEIEYIESRIKPM